MLSPSSFSPRIASFHTPKPGEAPPREQAAERPTRRSQVPPSVKGIAKNLWLACFRVSDP